MYLFKAIKIRNECFVLVLTFNYKYISFLIYLFVYLFVYLPSVCEPVPVIIKEVFSLMIITPDSAPEFSKIIY